MKNQLEVFRLPSYRNFIFNNQEYNLNTYPYMDIILGDYCNCRCKFCVADLLHEKLKLNVDIAKEKIEYANKVLGVKEFLILGGEPTIFKSLFEIITFLISLDVNKICITTNGHKLSNDYEFAKKLFASGITHLNLSLMNINIEKQKEINQSKCYVSIEDLKKFKELSGNVKIRINSNSFIGNNDTVEKIEELYDAVKMYVDNVKISSLLQTDSFSTINPVSSFTKDNRISDEEYNVLFHSAENYFKNKYKCGLIRNYDTLGFVENSLLNMNTTLIFNYNHTGRLMKEFEENKKINGFKLLPNGMISISWNRERTDLYVR